MNSDPKYAIRNGNFGNRNRKCVISPQKVSTDGGGNVISMPLVRNLKCFADPIESLLGRYDTPYQKVLRDGTVTESPYLCAGCKAKTGCQKVVEERISSDHELEALYASWEKDAQDRQAYKTDRFQLASFGLLRSAIEARTWTNSNDVAVVDDIRKASAERKRQRSRKKKSQMLSRRSGEDRRLREAAELHLPFLQVESARRLGILKRLASTQPWLRSLSVERMRFTCNVWVALKIFEFAKVKWKHVKAAAWLTGNNLTEGVPTASLATRIGEAVARCSRLEAESGGPPIWQT